MSELHLLAALRYVERNPVRAGLAAAAWDWPWSNAAAHATGAEDAVLCRNSAEHLSLWDYREWAELLTARAGGGECEAMRRATWKGEPLGPREFVRALERQTGWRLSVGERGRPRKKPVPEPHAREQASLSAADGWQKCKKESPRRLAAGFRSFDQVLDES